MRLKKLSDGTIELSKAKQICQNTQVIINAAKVMLDFAKFSGNKDDIFLNHDGILQSLKEIETRNKKPIKLGES